MTALALEPYVAPADLFGSGKYLDCEFSRWWVLHVRPRAEKSLARRLLGRNIPFFLPVFEKRQRIQRRLVTSYLPLFPGYLFVQTDDGALQAAAQTNLVANTIRVEDQQRLAQGLERIHDLIQSGAPLAPEPRLEPGMAAEITSGSLAGLRGTVVRRGGSTRLVIELNFLQQGASVEVEESMVQRI
jgi:transcription antitermination factor NusG